MEFMLGNLDAQTAKRVFRSQIKVSVFVVSEDRTRSPLFLRFLTFVKILIGLVRVGLVLNYQGRLRLSALLRYITVERDGTIGYFDRSNNLERQFARASI
jgi:hypothetical protein